MSRTRARRLCTISVLSAVFVAGGMVAAAIPTHAQAVHARSPKQAVQIVVRPFVVARYNFANCSTASPRTHPDLTCPETSALRHYLATRRLPAADAGLPFCRCQSAPLQVHVLSVRDTTAHSALVDVQWRFAGDSGDRVATDTFVVVEQGNGWLISDEYCANRPGTSVYNGVTGEKPCYRRNPRPPIGSGSNH